MDDLAADGQKLKGGSSDWVAVDEIGSCCWCVTKDVKSVVGNTKSSIVEAMIFTDLAHNPSSDRESFQIIKLRVVSIGF